MILPWGVMQNFVGDAMRGATWVALHNGGGVGWGEVINGGFGLVLDGLVSLRFISCILYRPLKLSGV